MAAPDSARHHLRTATASDHDAVDRTFSGYDLTDRHGYLAFLLAQASAFIPLEAAIDRSATAHVIADWPSRRRSELLLQDLARLDASPALTSALPAFDSAEAMLGAIYVLEGSRLGGRMLVRAVPEHFPKSFLSAGDSALWRSLLAVLEERLVTQAQRAAAIAAAREAFALFEKGARVVATTC